ncbi:Hypothetical predicted protein [Mytilus galloprovincialis]|uniref:Retrotransposon gag domain-containing protein n=1 Tax=Mytilus galloprovincialis TaxID=29158 RepID=A0A8B6BRH5_MYTGA|nr:Hypothetical predicted protein [Mytilus galloprovincialis]
MTLIIQGDFEHLKRKMEERFGHTAMKERYVTEATLRKRKPEESLRDFGQAIEDLYRRTFPGNPEIVEENCIKAFLDNEPDLIPAGAVNNSMQKECLRIGEKISLASISNQFSGDIEVEDWDMMKCKYRSRRNTKRKCRQKYVPDNYPRNNEIESQVRFYNRIDGVEEVDPRCLKIVHQNFRNREGDRRDSRETDFAEEIDSRGQVSVTRAGRPNEKGKNTMKRQKIVNKPSDFMNNCLFIVLTMLFYAEVFLRLFIVEI